MDRTALRALALVCLASLPFVTAMATMATADAVPRAAQVCKPFTKDGTKIQWSTVGTGFTCASAKHWVVKLSSETFPQKGVKVKLTGGPSRYHCFGTTDDTGRATIGDCYLGTVAFPKSGFQWFG